MARGSRSAGPYVRLENPSHGLGHSHRQNIANLARLEVREDELDHLAGELSNIIRFVEQLAEVDTDGVTPMTSVAHLELPQRADVVTTAIART